MSSKSPTIQEGGSQALPTLTNSKEYTRKAIFGVYLHALLVHAPLQRIFQQAKQIARATTNCQPGNAVPNLLRLQAKQLTGQLSSSLKNGETRVK